VKFAERIILLMLQAAMYPLDTLDQADPIGGSMPHMPATID
jgi:hypothetical protein